MRSMLENLVQTLPAHRHPELYKQVDLLDRAIEEHYSFAEDRALARIADPQGLGGTLGVQAAGRVRTDAAALQLGTGVDRAC
jgi:hypothetical protein